MLEISTDLSFTVVLIPRGEKLPIICRRICNLPTNCFSVFDYFVILALKGLMLEISTDLSFTVVLIPPWREYPSSKSHIVLQ